MPTRRKTRAELEFSGATRRNPGRYAAHTDHSSLPPLGSCPRSLSKTQKALWRQLVAMAPTGLLTAGDTFAVELCARLLDHSRTVAIMRASEVAALTNLLGRLGLTPADRARLDLPAQKTEEDDSFAGF